GARDRDKPRDARAPVAALEGEGQYLARLAARCSRSFAWSHTALGCCGWFEHFTAYSSPLRLLLVAAPSMKSSARASLPRPRRLSYFIRRWDSAACPSCQLPFR